jgi:hypothetical protein
MKIKKPKGVSEKGRNIKIKIKYITKQNKRRQRF